MLVRESGRSRMRCKAVAALACALLATAATAADLPAHTRLGAVFADQPVARAPIPPALEYTGPIVPWVANSPRVAGYYGTWFDFDYRNYYGTSPLLIFSRPSYSCAWYGGHCW
jgi:hypothetical protein